MAPEPGARSVRVDAALIVPVAQEHWDAPHATWFTMMGVGGGIFLLARLLGVTPRLGTWLGLPLVDVVSFVVIAVGGLVLISTLARPWRFLRAVMRPGTSWISRGALADFVFLAVGGLLVLPDLRVAGAAPFAWLPWDAAASTALGRGMEVLALASAAIVIFYAGQVLADARGIPYWESPAIPTQFVLSSLAMSLGVVMLLETLGSAAIPTAQFWLLVALLVILLATIVWHLRADAHAPGKAESLERLGRAPFRGVFRFVVLGAGVTVPLAAALVGVAAPSTRDAMGGVVLVTTVVAGYALRLLTLRVGIYRPIHAVIGFTGKTG